MNLLESLYLYAGLARFETQMKLEQKREREREREREIARANEIVKSLCL